MEKKNHTIIDEYRQSCSACAFYHKGTCTSCRGHNFKHGGAYCEYFRNKNKNIKL